MQSYDHVIQHLQIFLDHENIREVGKVLKEKACDKDNSKDTDLGERIAK